jgi:hypothetical protein
MTADKTCILFDGGKRIELSGDLLPGNEGLKMTRDQDGNWDIIIKTRISAAEAKNTIFKFTDLTPPAGVSFDDAFPNMAFFSAFDGTGQSVELELDGRSEFIPVYDRNDKGSITLKMNLTNFGKTQNGKTQNAAGA